MSRGARPRPRSGWVAESARHKERLYVRCEPELAERARQVTRERGVTLAEVLKRGLEAIELTGQ